MHTNRFAGTVLLLGMIAAYAGLIGLIPATATAQILGDFIILGYNDLGMHCMNQWHVNLSILPPYNTLMAQVIERGDANTLPRIVSDGITVEYSIPGNTYSAGKTDFWDHVYALFGVDLPPDIGLTGKGVTGELDPEPHYFIAEGIPITPFPDETPDEEDPFQQALLVARDMTGAELAASEPVIPVSVEVGCVSASCHASESDLLNNHPREAGFDPNDRPILCAECHADPALGMQGIPQAGYFSYRIHEKHTFLDDELPGIAGCYTCHPGTQTQCLRGTMNEDYGLICQDCHGDMENMKHSIEQGRVPWVDEPACRECHTAAYGEPVGQLYRLSQGHGGVLCGNCHGSPHAIYPSREARDNAHMVALQGHAGTLSDCAVCHGTTPSGPGPHGMIALDVVEAELLDARGVMHVHPLPMKTMCTLEFAGNDPSEGKLVVFDAQGRTLRILRPETAGNGTLRAVWDRRGRNGSPVAPGIYFVRWDAGEWSAAAKVLVL